MTWLRPRYHNGSCAHYDFTPFNRGSGGRRFLLLVDHFSNWDVISGGGYMFQRQYKITAAEGLHARPAAQLVHVYALCPFAVTLIRGDKTVNAKSILQILSLGARHGEVLTVQYDTDDGTQVDSLEKSLEEIIEVVAE